MPYAFPDKQDREKFFLRKVVLISYKKKVVRGYQEVLVSEHIVSEKNNLIDRLSEERKIKPLSNK